MLAVESNFASFANYTGWVAKSRFFPQGTLMPGSTMKVAGSFGPYSQWGSGVYNG